MSITLSAISTWWLQKRLQYNKALLFTALVGFVVQSLKPAFNSNMMISGVVLEMRISGVCFLLFLILANVAFTFGSVIDLIFNHQSSRQFRDQLFLGGYWFATVALILCMTAFLCFYQ